MPVAKVDQSGYESAAKIVGRTNRKTYGLRGPPSAMQTLAMSPMSSALHVRKNHSRRELRTIRSCGSSRITPTLQSATAKITVSSTRCGSLHVASA